MNKTNLEHAGYAVIIQCLFYLATGSIWVGAAFAVGFFLGREHAQYQRTLGKITFRTDILAFKVWKWSRDSQFDLLFPLIAVIVLGASVELFSDLKM